jgi:hypothetical protein
MKTLIYLLLAAPGLTFGMGPSVALAQDRPDEARPGQPSSQLPAGTVPRYLVTYFHSQGGLAGARSASIVSITNQSPVICTVAVDWKNQGGGVACGTSLTIGPGVDVDFCTRNLPNSITLCNSTCPGGGLVFNEGSAVVGSSTALGCDKIAVSARTFYASVITDFPPTAITDAKVVKYGFGNSGD